MWRNWRRTAIALVALAVGVLLLVFMDGLFIGSDQAIFGNAVRLYGGNIQVHAPGFRERARRYPLLPVADADYANLWAFAGRLLYATTPDPDNSRIPGALKAFELGRKRHRNCP